MVAFRADRNVGTLFCRASPRPAFRRAPCRPDAPVVCPGFGLDRFWTRQAIFPDMLCMRRVYRDKKASAHWSAAKNKERFSSR